MALLLRLSRITGLSDIPIITWILPAGSQMSDKDDSPDEHYPGISQRCRLSGGAKSLRSGLPRLGPRLYPVLSRWSLFVLFFVGFSLLLNGRAPVQAQAPGGMPAEEETEKQEPALRPEREPRTESGKLASQFLDRMKSLTSERANSDTAAMAKKWADLHSWCVNNHLSVEARMCAMRATLLAPDHPAVARALGRTAQFSGARVTPEQARFLRQALPEVVVHNQHMSFEDLKVGLKSDSIRSVPPGRKVKIKASAENSEIIVRRTTDDGPQEARISLDLTNGCEHEIAVVSSELLPAVFEPPLKAFRRALEEWDEYRDPDHPWPAEDLEQRKNWTKTEDGWQARVDDFSVDFGVTAPLKLHSVTVQGVRLTGLNDNPPSVLLRHGAYRVKGRVEGYDWRRQPVTFQSVGKRPAIVQPMRGKAWGRLWNGIWEDQGRSTRYKVAKFRGKDGPIFSFRYAEKPVKSVRRIMALQSQNYRLEDEISEVNQKFRELRREALHEEMAGVLLGSWQTDLWLYERMMPVMEQQWNVGRSLHEQRGTAPYGVPAGKSADQKNGRITYRDWPLFRHAIVPGTSPFIQQMTDARRFELLPLTEGNDAMAMLQDLEEDLPVEDELSIVKALRWMIDDEVIAYLRSKAEDSPEISIRQRSLLSLGEIGTEASLKACRNPAIEEEIRATSKAALAGAGEPTLLENLPDELQSMSETERSVFLDQLLAMDAPTALLAMKTVGRFYRQPENADRCAHKLASIGSTSAAFLLGQIIQAQGRAYPEVCRKFAPESVGPLVYPLGSLLGHPAEGNEAAIILGQSGNKDALAFLQSRANAETPRVIAGLAASGHADVLKEAADMVDGLKEDHVRRILNAWGKMDARTDKWTWNATISQKDALAFMEAVLTDSNSPTTRIAAARSLTKMGHRPDPADVVAIASMPPQTQEVPEPTERPDAGPGEGQRRREEMRRGMPRQRKDERQKEAVEEKSDPRVAAIELLSKIGPGETASTLINLAQTAPNPEVRIAALKALGKTKNTDAVEHLQGVANQRITPEDRQDIAQNARLRVAAAYGLALAAHPSLGKILKEMWFEKPIALPEAPTPEPEDGRRTENRDSEQESMNQRLQILAKGVTDAILALPHEESLLGTSADKQAANEVLQALVRIAERGAMSEEKAEAGNQISPALAVRCLARQDTLSEHGWQLLSQLSDHWKNLPEAVQTAMLTGMRRNGANRATKILAGVWESAMADESPDERFVGLWQDICRKFAVSGRPLEYDLLARSVTLLDQSTVQAIIDEMSARGEEPAEEYFRFLAALAAREVEVERLMPPEFYESVAGGKGIAGEERQREDNNGGGRYRGRRDDIYRGGRNNRARNMPESSDKSTDQGSFRSTDLPKPRWAKEMSIKAKCLKLLERGDPERVAPVLTDENLGLLDHQWLGPVVAWTMHKMNDGFDLKGYLEKRYVADVSDLDRQATVLCAIKDSSDPSEDFLASIILGKLREDDMPENGTEEPERRRNDRRNGRERRQPERGNGGSENWNFREGAEGEEPQYEPESADLAFDKTMRYVGRGLGMMGNYGVLRQAIAYRRVGRQLQYMHPLDRRLGAIRGMAWLPPNRKPLTRLRRFARSLPEPEMKDACARAALSYLRMATSQQEGE